MGPAWGGGPRVAMEESHPVGVDSEEVLRELGGYSDAEVAALLARGATVAVADADAPARRSPDAEALRVHRGELARIDADHDGWREFADVEAVR